ncbi:MAG: hypothetical protein COV67_02315 [Nitrospinae bacterium CG11_big_fil_rev_8_21_14_0_20_56_8]|nr:MAG: hypothetical protein COV67_02315 [Nitrospinae bacterium CG11_big_fil_rev_8_21_14_0_20_56_8]
MNELDITPKVGRRNAVNKTSYPLKKSDISPKVADGETDRVSLSSASRVQVSIKSSPPPDIRMDLVNKFRSVLDQGDYQVKADEIADKIVQKIREHKNRMIL